MTSARTYSNHAWHERREAIQAGDPDEWGDPVVTCEFCDATTTVPADTDPCWAYVCDDCLDRAWTNA